MRLERPLAPQIWLWPSSWCELVDLGDLGRWQTGEQIFQIIDRVNPMPPATAQQCVNHGTAFASFGMPNEHAWKHKKGDFP